MQFGEKLRAPMATISSTSNNNNTSVSSIEGVRFTSTNISTSLVRPLTLGSQPFFQGSAIPPYYYPPNQLMNLNQPNNSVSSSLAMLAAARQHQQFMFSNANSLLFPFNNLTNTTTRTTLATSTVGTNINLNTQVSHPGNYYFMNNQNVPRLPISVSIGSHPLNLLNLGQIPPYNFPVNNNTLIKSLPTAVTTTIYSLSNLSSINFTNYQQNPLNSNINRFTLPLQQIGPAVLLSPTTPSNMNHQQFQRLKVEDALSYLDQVKMRFSNQPQVYNDFLDIMKEFKSQSIDTPGVIGRVSTLFKGHSDLIIGFNTFLPPGFKVEVISTASTTSTITITNAIGNATPSSPFIIIPSASASSSALTPLTATGTPSFSPFVSSNVATLLMLSTTTASTSSPSTTGAGTFFNDTDSSLPFAHALSITTLSSATAYSLNSHGNNNFTAILPAAAGTSSSIVITAVGTTSATAVPTNSSFVSYDNGASYTFYGSSAGLYGNGKTSIRLPLSSSTILGGESSVALAGHHNPTEIKKEFLSEEMMMMNKVPSAILQPAEFNHAINYVNKIKHRFQNKPEVYKAFLEILHRYQKEQRILRENKEAALLSITPPPPPHTQSTSSLGTSLENPQIKKLKQLTNIDLSSNSSGNSTDTESDDAASSIVSKKQHSKHRKFLTEAEVYSRVAKLFENQGDLLEEFAQFLPDACRHLSPSNRSESGTPTESIAPGISDHQIVTTTCQQLSSSNNNNPRTHTHKMKQESSLGFDQTAAPSFLHHQQQGLGKDDLGSGSFQKPSSKATHSHQTPYATKFEEHGRDKKRKIKEVDSFSTLIESEKLKMKEEYKLQKEKRSFNSRSPGNNNNNVKEIIGSFTTSSASAAVSTSDRIISSTKKHQQTGAIHKHKNVHNLPTTPSGAAVNLSNSSAAVGEIYSLSKENEEYFDVEDAGDAMSVIEEEADDYEEADEHQQTIISAASRREDDDKYYGDFRGVPSDGVSSNKREDLNRALIGAKKFKLNVKDVSLSQASKYGTLTDYAFFDKVMNALNNSTVYNNFMRCLNLYIMDVITESDLVCLAQRFFVRHPELLKELKGFLGYNDAGELNVAQTFKEEEEGDDEDGSEGGSEDLEDAGGHPGNEPKDRARMDKVSKKQQSGAYDKSTGKGKQGLGKIPSADTKEKGGEKQQGGYNTTSSRSYSAATATKDSSKRIPTELTLQLDYASLKKCGVSYRALPKTYQLPICSGRTLLCQQVLNDTYVSFASWSEDSSFVSSRKTSFEENIYRIEDERFELDVVIESTRHTCRVLEQTLNQILNNANGLNHFLSTNDFPNATSNINNKKGNLAAAKLDDKLGGRSAVLHRKTIYRIYGDKANEIIEGIKANPQVAIPYVVRRLKAKIDEWRDAQRKFNRIWRDQVEKNYLKSLDHQGITFKQNDIKGLRSKALLNEIETVFEEQKEAKNQRTLYRNALMLANPKQNASLRSIYYDVFLNDLSNESSYLYPKWIDKTDFTQKSSLSAVAGPGHPGGALVPAFYFLGVASFPHQLQSAHMVLDYMSALKNDPLDQLLFSNRSLPTPNFILPSLSSPSNKASAVSNNIVQTAVGYKEETDPNNLSSLNKVVDEENAVNLTSTLNNEILNDSCELLIYHAKRQIGISKDDKRKIKRFLRRFLPTLYGKPENEMTSSSGSSSSSTSSSASLSGRDNNHDEKELEEEDEEIPRGINSISTAVTELDEKSSSKNKISHDNKRTKMTTSKFFVTRGDGQSFNVKMESPILPPEDSKENIAESNVILKNGRKRAKDDGSSGGNGGTKCFKRKKRDNFQASSLSTAGNEQTDEQIIKTDVTLYRSNDLPLTPHDNKYFVGNDHFYVFFRLHHVLCDRLGRLWRFSRDAVQNYNRASKAAFTATIEINATASRDPNDPSSGSSNCNNDNNLLTAQSSTFIPQYDIAKALLLKNPNAILPDQYYKTFLDLIHKLLDGNIDSGSYEDALREMFTINAYPAFTLDKVIQNAVRQLNNIVTDEESTFMVKTFMKLHKSSDTLHGQSPHYHPRSSSYLVNQNPVKSIAGQDLYRQSIEHSYRKRIEDNVTEQTLYQFRYYNEQSLLAIKMLETFTLPNTLNSGHGGSNQETAMKTGNVENPNSTRSASNTPLITNSDITTTLNSMPVGSGVTSSYSQTLITKAAADTKFGNSPHLPHLPALTVNCSSFNTFAAGNVERLVGDLDFFRTLGSWITFVQQEFAYPLYYSSSPNNYPNSSNMNRKQFEFHHQVATPEFKNFVNVLQKNLLAHPVFLYRNFIVGSGYRKFINVVRRNNPALLDLPSNKSILDETFTSLSENYYSEWYSITDNLEFNLSVKEIVPATDTPKSNHNRRWHKYLGKSNNEAVKPILQVLRRYVTGTEDVLYRKNAISDAKRIHRVVSYSKLRKFDRFLKKWANRNLELEIQCSNLEEILNKKAELLPECAEILLESFDNPPYRIVHKYLCR